MNFLAIDPGVHACACALFGADGRLTAVGVNMHPDGKTLRGVVIERPVIRGNNTPDPQTIVDLAWAGARFAYAFGVPVHEVTPQQWKGQVPKPIHHARVLREFLLDHVRGTPEYTVLDRCVPGWAERIDRAQALVAKAPGKYPGAKAYGSWEGHNLLDAVALGVWARENLTALRG